RAGAMANGFEKAGKNSHDLADSGIPTGENGANPVFKERLKQGVFTLSIDVELIWGTLDLFGPEQFRDACQDERKLIDRLLALLAEFEISATWCTLGHLFLHQCNLEKGCKHPEIVRPRHAWCKHDWFFHDPCGTEESAPLFYGRSLVDKIRACPVP